MNGSSAILGITRPAPIPRPATPSLSTSGMSPPATALLENLRGDLVRLKAQRGEILTLRVDRFDPLWHLRVGIRHRHVEPAAVQLGGLRQHGSSFAAEQPVQHHLASVRMWWTVDGHQRVGPRRIERDGVAYALDVQPHAFLPQNLEPPIADQSQANRLG